MVTRLVLGAGTLAHHLLERVEKAGRVRVVTPDESRAETLREQDVDAVVGDPADPATYPDGADVVAAAGHAPTANLAAARSARDAFPDAMLLAYAGAEADRATVADLESVADRVVDPVRATADEVLDLAVGSASNRTRQLRRVLREATQPLAVVTHDNPDPDAIASALALAQIARSLDVETDVCYFGDISHQENRAFVNLLDIPLVNLGAGEFEGYGSVALVDHSRPGVNDSLPPETPVDVVIDHHPPRGPVEGKFVDLRSDVGATSTLLCEHLRRFGIVPSERVATALLYGIRVDTRDFTREVSETDFEAAAFLLPHVDHATLDRVESPSVSVETLETLGRAVTRRDVRDGALASCVGEIRNRDALAQAAERLLDLEGIHTTLVYGFMEGTVFISGRTRGADLDLGETLRDAFGQIGSAGGHADMAGAQVPLGILADVEDDSAESLAAVVEEIVTGRFFDALHQAPSAPVPDEGLTYEYTSEEAASLATPWQGPAAESTGGSTAVAGDETAVDETEEDDDAEEPTTEADQEPRADGADE